MRNITKQRWPLWAFMLLFLVLIGIGEWSEHYRREEIDNCMESLSFTVKNNRSEQEIRCFIEEEERIAYLFLPTYANMSSVVIDFGGADRVMIGQGEDTVSLKRGADLGALEIGKQYDLSFMKQGEIIDQEQLVIMHSANLPAMFLETESGSMDKVDADKDYEEAGRVVLIDLDGSVVCADKLQHISGRGNSTWAYAKKSYGIKLKESADLFQMGSARNWILLSNVEDNTYLRNKITYDMAIAAGMEGAPQSRYLDVYINHEYHGMYQLCEKIEIDQQRIPIEDLGLQNKKLNKEIESAERFHAGDRKGVLVDHEPYDRSGGYLLERDVSEKYGSEISGFVTPILRDNYTVKEPKYASQEEMDYISRFVSDMEAAIVAEDGINADTGMSYLDYIDLKSFAQKYIIEELCKNNGGGATSSFFYKPQDSISTKLFGGPVWDYDKAYARIYGFDGTPRNLCYLCQRGANTVLFWHLNKHPEFQQMVSSCYEEFFSDYIQRVCEELIVAYASEIYAAEEMDGIRWKKIYGERDSYGQRSQIIKEFLTERKEFLDEVWIGQKELCTVHFIAEEYSRDTYMSVIEGECPGALPIGEPGNVSDGLVFDGWFTQNGELFDGTSPLYEDVTVYSSSHALTAVEE
ncbi:MAG: CotH kinase family protein [Lachnospiraceae bacterium]